MCAQNPWICQHLPVSKLSGSQNWAARHSALGHVLFSEAEHFQIIHLFWILLLIFNKEVSMHKSWTYFIMVKHNSCYRTTETCILTWPFFSTPHGLCVIITFNDMYFYCSIMSLTSVTQFSSTFLSSRVHPGGPAADSGEARAQPSGP